MPGRDWPPCSVYIGCWFIFAAANPSGGGLVADDAARGVMEFAVGLGKVFKML